MTNNRESLTINLEQRYNNNWAGGAYNVHECVVTSGFNTISIPNSYYDMTYTIGQGFKTKMDVMQTELKDAENGKTSNELSAYIEGFDNTKYY